MIVAGVGCRRGASTPDIEAAIRAALDRTGIAPHALDCIATTAAKNNEAGMVAAAAKFGVDLVLIPGAELQAANDRTATRSGRVLALTGVHSVAEAAARGSPHRARRLR